MGDNNEHGDIPAAPSWINGDLFQQALRNDGEENAKVAAISVKFALGAGDNYGSTIYRVKTTLTDGGERSFIMKAPAPTAAVASISKELAVFNREASMLAEIIPKMQALLEQASPGSFPPMSPRCPLHGDSPEEFIVMEDLAPGGFRLADRKRGLGLRHSLLAFRVLARFHAASFALLREEPELAKRFDNIWETWRHINPLMNTFVQGGVQAVADACRSWPGYEQYADVLDKYKVNALETYAKLNDPKPGAFNVLTHGDYWSSNLLFRYNDGEPTELRMVDLQLSRVASPAVDLVYLLAGSVSEDVHIHHQDLLLREYHHELKKTMSLLRLEEAPSLEELREAVSAHMPWAMFVVLCHIPMLRGDSVADMTARCEGGDSAGVAAPLENPRVQRWMQRVLPEYIAKGWIRAE